MPAILPSLFLIGLMIWSLPLSAQETRQSTPIDGGTDGLSKDHWISSWVAEHLGLHVDLQGAATALADPEDKVANEDLPAAGEAQDEADQFGPRELSRIQGTVCADTEPPRPTGNLADENRRLQQQLEATRTVLTVVDRQAIKSIKERKTLTAKAQQDQQRIIALERELETSREKIDQAKRANELLSAEKGELQQRNRQRIETLESRLEASQEKNNQLNSTNELLSAEKKKLQQPEGWIAQLLGYDRGYIDAIRRAGISAGKDKEKGTLTQRIKTALGRDLTIPDLAEFDLAFVGGHVVFINDVATGRLAYQDIDGSPLGFWLTPKIGPSSNVSFGQNGDLNIVHWQGNRTEYAITTTVDWSKLALIAGKLYQGHSE